MALRLQPRRTHLPARRIARWHDVASKTKAVPAQRIRSLDALRGFDMLWIIGGDAVAASIANISHNSRTETVMTGFSEHVPWVGLHFYDLIFPLFIVIMGVALPHSIGERLEQGESRRSVLGKIFRRTALLILLGLVYNGLFLFQGWEQLRLFGVLQRLGLAYCATSVLMVFTSRKTQAAVGVGLLVLYWALMNWIPVPGYPLGTLSENGNAANYLDRLLLLRHQMFTSYGDPEGLLSTIPAISTCILGVFAGYWLQSDRPKQRKAVGLVLAGIACIGLGLLWMPAFPIIKKIWTSSFALTTGGLSLLLLATFYWIIDVRGWSKWAIPLVVIGMNPLLIYLLAEVVDFEGIAGYFLNGPLHSYSTYQALGIAMGSLLAKWLLLYFLYKQKIFVRI